MEIKASEVKKLREKTGAGMMDCKKALQEAGGDPEKAEKILKELGLAAAAKRAGRATNEGRIFSQITENKGVLVELSCETDFVARNTDFINLGNELAATIAAEDLKPGDDKIEGRIKNAASVIKENIVFKNLDSIPAESNDLLVEYIHGEGRIGVIVKVTVSDSSLLTNEEVKQFAFDSALHIAAFNPLFLNTESVDRDYVSEQEETFRKQAENLGKPEKVVEGIVKGKMKKHFSEICLYEQPFVKDDKVSVSQKMKDLGKSLDGEVKITGYLYRAVGQE
jgi:elongation factor Ts